MLKKGNCAELLQYRTFRLTSHLPPACYHEHTHPFTYSPFHPHTPHTCTYARHTHTRTHAHTPPHTHPCPRPRPHLHPHPHPHPYSKHTFLGTHRIQQKWSNTFICGHPCICTPLQSFQQQRLLLFLCCLRASKCKNTGMSV